MTFSPKKRRWNRKQNEKSPLNTADIYNHTHPEEENTSHTTTHTHTRRNDEEKSKREREWRTIAEREIEAGGAQHEHAA